MKNVLRWAVTVAGCLALALELCCCYRPPPDCQPDVVAADCDPDDWDELRSCCAPEPAECLEGVVPADCDPAFWDEEQLCCLDGGQIVRAAAPTVATDEGGAVRP